VVTIIASISRPVQEEYPSYTVLVRLKIELLIIKRLSTNQTFLAAMRSTILAAGLYASFAACQDVTYDYVIAGAGTAGLVCCKTSC